MDKREYKEISSMAASGDAKAFSQLYTTIYREMYYTAFYSLANDKDAIEAVVGTVRDGFKAVNRLHSEESFRVFMFKTLCARIKMRFKEYSRGADTDGTGGNTEREEEFSEAKRRLSELENTDRMCAAMYIAGKFSFEEISAYTGIIKSSVKKRVCGALDVLNLD